MSRVRPQRRFPISAAAGVTAFAALVSALCLCLAAPAQAQTEGGRDAVSRTVIGGRRASAECGRLAARGDATDRAVQACTRALDERMASSDRVIVLVNLGVIHTRRGDGDEAIANFNAALELDPNSPEAHVNRGAALVMMRRHGEAVASLTQALSLGVDQPYKAYYNRGAAREALGDVRGAFEDYTTALDIHPEWAPAEAEIARFVRDRQEQLAGIIEEMDEEGAEQGLP